MAINCYYIENNSFHGLQISNLNTQELLMHFIIVFSQLFNRSVKPNIRFLIRTSKLAILLTAYMVLALLRGDNFSIRRYDIINIYIYIDLGVKGHRWSAPPILGQIWAPITT